MLHLPSRQATITSPVLSDSSSRSQPEEPNAVERYDWRPASEFDRSAVADERVKDAVQNALAALEQEWVVLGDFCFVARGKEIPVDFIALHPRKGVALIDVATEGDPVAPRLFRLLLRSRGFEQRFPGYLPIAHLRLRSSEAPQLSAHLEQAFSAESPIGVAADGWIREASRLLTLDPLRGRTGLLAAAAHSLGRRRRPVALAIGSAMLLLIVTTALLLSRSALEEGLILARERTGASVQPSLQPPQIATATDPGSSTSTSVISLHESDTSDHASKPGVLPAEAKPERAMPDAGSNGASAFPRRADPDGRTESQPMDQSPKGPQLKASRPPAKGRVQLAAADTIIEVERVWAELQSAQPDVLGEVRVTVSRATLADGRVVYRLQTASMTAEEAQRLCETLHQRQVPCFVRR